MKNPKDPLLKLYTSAEEEATQIALEENTQRSTANNDVKWSLTQMA